MVVREPQIAKTDLVSLWWHGSEFVWRATFARTAVTVVASGGLQLCSGSDELWSATCDIGVDWFCRRRDAIARDHSDLGPPADG